MFNQAYIQSSNIDKPGRNIVGLEEPVLCPRRNEAVRNEQKTGPQPISLNVLLVSLVFAP